MQVIDNSIHILRLGSILLKDLQKIHTDVILADNKNLPNLNFKHYETNSDSILVYSDDNSKMINKICNLLKNYSSAVILCCDENLDIYINEINTLNLFHTNIKVFSYGSKYNLKEISKHLFNNLSNISKLNSDIILIEGLKQDGTGLVLMNKLNEFAKGSFILL